MIRNYLLVAVRNIKRSPGYTFINVAGLAIGLASCVLISLYILDELSYDQFHEKGDRIYRLVRVKSMAGGKLSYHLGTSGGAGPALSRDFPEIEASARFVNWGSAWTRYGDRAFSTQFCVTDPAFLDIFDFPLVRGDRATALSQHGSVLISESEAARFFGAEDPIGKTIEVDDRYMAGIYTITGVLADPPIHSTLSFGIVSTTYTNTIWMNDMFTKWQVGSSFHPTANFFLLRPGVDPYAFEQKLQQLIPRYMGTGAVKTNAYRILNFPQTYLHARPKFGIGWYGDIANVYLFASVGVFILLIAAINFMNLATARSAGRAREVGLRKTAGAYRSQLIGQFLSESVLTAFLAAAIAALLILLFLPEMNAFAGKAILWEDAWATIAVLLTGLAGLVGLLAGLYPAFFLSSFDPAKVLKGTLSAGAGSKAVRKVLVIFQFAISVFLMVGTTTVYFQMRHVQTMNLGFDKDQMLITWIFSTDRRLTDRYNAVKAEFLKHPNILKATGSHSTMGSGGQLDRVFPEGHNETEWRMRVIGVDESFLDTYGIQLIAGRGFDPAAFSTDTTKAFILNETAVRRLGWTLDGDVTAAVGKSFGWSAGGHQEGRVIGVVKDFHNRSLREEIRPVAISMWIPKLNVLSLKIRGQDIPETRAYIDEVWRKFIPDKPPGSVFLDEELNQMYEQEVRTGSLSAVGAGLAVFIACMGLVGLASFMAEQRTREVGIRKAIGSSDSQILVLMTQEFMVLVAVANVVGLPASYFLMREWLTEFAYRIPLDVFVFAPALIMSMVIALVTVSYHAVRAMHLDPVTALHHE